MDKKENGKKKYSVPAVDMAFRIITLLSRKKFKKSKLTEIANALSLNPTTCFRILFELQQLSVVNYDVRTKQYSLGPYLVVLGERAKEHLQDISIIKHYLEKMTAQTGLTTIHVSRVGENRLTIISKVEGDNFGVKVSVGRHFALYDGAYGKCIMAYIDQADYYQLDEFFKNYSSQEIEKIKTELGEVRKNGYAISYNETIAGIFGVAAPIFNFNNQVEMAISFVGVSAQQKKEDLQPLIDMITESAKEISTKINEGYN